MSEEEINKLLAESKERGKLEVLPAPPPPSDLPKYRPLAFNDAVEFLYTFDRALREGKKELHPWQVEVLLFLSNREAWQFTISLPLVFYLLACNGSGKDAYIIAGFATYVLCCWTRYKVVITSSSDQQLDTQTRTYIKDLCEEVNSFLKQEWGIPDVIGIKVESFKSKDLTDGTQKFSLTGSQILTFVTKEGGKAEGHHPWPDAPEGEGVILIANEAKTIPGEIWNHFAKCTYNIFLKVSSAGEAKEHFYNGYKEARDWVDGYIPGQPIKRKITYKDCPNITPERIAIEIKEHGENSPWFRTSRKSEFVSSDTEVVIESSKLESCLAKGTGFYINIGIPLKAGLDIGGGGDPSALAVFDNNRCEGLHEWNFRDTQLTVDHLCGDGTQRGLFYEYKLTPENIKADDNGLGQAVIDAIYRREIIKGDPSKGYWEIHRQRAQFAAFNKVVYLNRGAEWWFRFKRLVEEGLIDFNGWLTEAYKEELTKRHYTTGGLGKFKLWDKADEKAEGFKSPNVADAIVLAFADVNIYEFIERNKTIIRNPSRIAPETLGSKEISQTTIYNDLFKFNKEQQIEHSSTDIQSVLNSIYD